MSRIACFDATTPLPSAAQQHVQYEGRVLTRPFSFCRKREGGVAILSAQQITRLAKRRSCPRCNLEKTEGNALCRRCRFKLPAHMRLPLQEIEAREQWIVASALRAAANYFDVHYKSIRAFGGGRVR
jgi:uncharacterized paraquat-inducible protein A